MVIWIERTEQKTTSERRFLKLAYIHLAAHGIELRRSRRTATVLFNAIDSHVAITVIRIYAHVHIIRQ